MQTFPKLNIIEDNKNAGIKILASDRIRTTHKGENAIWADNEEKEYVAVIGAMGIGLNINYDWIIGNIEGHDDPQLICLKKGTIKR